VFKELGLNCVELACAVGNARSCAIPERLGFTREGVLRQREWLYDHFVDHVSYSMLAAEWSRRRAASRG
jgi:ribosomal-protein-serine acetyltransferase